MRRFGFEMKRLAITLTLGLKDPGTNDLQAAVLSKWPSGENYFLKEDTSSTIIATGA